MSMLHDSCTPAMRASARRRDSSRSGITLLDLLVVTAVVASLFSVAVINLSEARRSVMHLESADRLHDVGVAYQQHWQHYGDAPVTEQWREDIASFLPGGADASPAKQSLDSIGDVLTDEESSRWWYCRGYAINGQAESFKSVELGRIVLLEYDREIARPLANETAGEWKVYREQLELPLVNVLYGDYSVRALAPELLDPTDHRNLVYRWLPRDEN